jgi:hypothetical protein
MSKKTTLTEKYPRVGKVVFERLYEGDPTKTKKYFEFMLRTWSEKSISPVNFTTKKLVEWVNSFEEHLPYIEQKDIYHSQYRNISNFIETITSAEIEKSSREFTKSEHVQVLLETENYVLLRPLTHLGSLKYGAQTRWCTASRANPETFRNYFGRGYLAYCIAKNEVNKEYTKFALFTEDARNPFGGEVLIYNPQDNAVQDYYFTEKKWDYGDMYQIISTFRLEASKHFTFKRAKTQLNHSLTSLISLDFDSIKRNWEFVSSYETDNDQLNQLRQKLNEAINQLQNYATV